MFSAVYLIPSMVSDVAAMFVATTTFRTERLGGSNTLFCSSEIIRKFQLVLITCRYCTVEILRQTK